jgi:hypothetical protein
MGKGVRPYLKKLSKTKTNKRTVEKELKFKSFIHPADFLFWLLCVRH